MILTLVKGYYTLCTNSAPPPHNQRFAGTPFPRPVGRSAACPYSADYTDLAVPNKTVGWRETRPVARCFIFDFKLTLSDTSFQKPSGKCYLAIQEQNGDFRT